MRKAPGQYVRGLSSKLWCECIYQFAHGFGVPYRVACSAGSPIPYGNNQSAVVDHVLIAPLETILTVLGLEQSDLVAPLEDRTITAAALIGPMAGLVPARQDTLQRDGIVPLQFQHHLSGPGVHPLGHTGQKIVDVVVMDGA